MRQDFRVLNEFGRARAGGGVKRLLLLLFLGGILTTDCLPLHSTPAGALAPLASREKT